MKRLESDYVLAPPPTRPLKIFASDPMLGRTAGNRITIQVANEPLEPGPRGSRFEVIDYDGAHQRFYPPVILDDPAILMQGGLDPTESDPRFHQQMVYAVAMKTLENFEHALGRPMGFRRGKYERLRLFPHAFYGANAFYDRNLNGILFGYFRADKTNPGPNLPGQNVFTCLSHDIIAHEMSHAVVDRLRRHFMEPSNGDVLAFHEGFSDIIAIFQHFSFPEILRGEIQRARTDLSTPNLLADLARQFGYATGSGKALRSALDNPDPKLYQDATEPHDRGSILVAAVFAAFFATYQKKIRDLLRIATGGTGTLPQGDLHPDLVNRVANEASKTAQSILTMCIRAFDYLPPVDITFGDYLRALVTADYELVPADGIGQRASMIEAFRLRGVYPERVASLAEESLVWENSGDVPMIPVATLEMLHELTFAATSFSRLATSSRASNPIQQSSSMSNEGEEVNVSEQMARQLHQYAVDHADKLLLDPAKTVQVQGFHPAFRVAPNGQLLIELIVQFTQQDAEAKSAFGGIPFRGGTTVVASADGRVRYVIAKPLRSAQISQATVRDEAEARFQRQQAYIERCDLTDVNLPYRSDAYLRNRSLERMSLALLHQRINR